MVTYSTDTGCSIIECNIANAIKLAAAAPQMNNVSVFFFDSVLEFYLVEVFS